MLRPGGVRGERAEERPHSVTLQVSVEDRDAPRSAATTTRQGAVQPLETERKVCGQRTVLFQFV